MLENRLKAFAEYDVDFKFQQDWFIIGVRFNPQWVIVEPSNHIIEYMEKDGRHYYGAPVDSVKIDEIFDCIKETVEYNKDIERKMELFSQALDNLQTLFANEKYEDLLTLEFKLHPKKETKSKPNKKKKTPKKRTENETEQQPDSKAEETIQEKIDEPIVTENVNGIEIPDDGVIFVDTIAEAYKEEEERNKSK